MAYIRIEMEGEDPALQKDRKYIEELTRELLEDFAEDPQAVLNELDGHIAAMQAGARPGTETGGGDARYETRQEPAPGPEPGAVRQWKQMLEGSVLSYS
ncbi:MAG: hypothetical protein U9R74_06645, partial [Pseudomonadota bacterium]|nr:hypothetical protein [Pseudomonadota bacterium]